MIENSPSAAATDHKATQLSAEGEAAIGRIAIWAAHLERHLAELEQRLKGPTSRYSLFAGRSIKETRSLIRSNALLEQAEKLQILRVLADAKKSLDRRNSVIHAAIGSSVKPGAATFRGQNYPDRTLSANELDNIAKRLHESSWNVFDCSMVVARALGKLH